MLHNYTHTHCLIASSSTHFSATRQAASYVHFITLTALILSLVMHDWPTRTQSKGSIPTYLQTDCILSNVSLTLFMMYWKKDRTVLHFGTKKKFKYYYRTGFGSLEWIGRLSINSYWENLCTTQALCAARTLWNRLISYSKVPLHW